jgi:fucose permease
MGRVILLLAVVVCVPALLMMTAAAIGAAAPDLKIGMRLTQPQVGLIAGTFFIAAGLSLPFVGRAVDRHGPTVCVLTGLAIAATGAAVFALAQGPALAIAGYALIGSAYAVGPPAYGLLAARTLPPRVLPLGMAGLSFSIGVAVSLGSAIGQALPDDGGWRISLLGLAVGAPLLGLLIWMLRGRISAACGPLVASSGSNPQGNLSIASILSIREVRICCFVAFAMGGTLYSTGSLWNEFISRVVWEHTAAQKSSLVSLYWIATMLGAPTAALVALRASPFVLLRVMTALACVAVSAWILGPRVLGAAAALPVLIFMGLVISALPLVMACAVRSGPKLRAGTCVGLVQSSSLIGSFALLWLPSLLVLIPESTASGRALFGGAAFVLLLAIAHLFTWRLQPSLDYDADDSGPGFAVRIAFLQTTGDVAITAADILIVS